MTKLTFWDSWYDLEALGDGVHVKMVTPEGVVLSRRLTEAETEGICIKWISSEGSWTHGIVRVSTTLSDGREATIDMAIDKVQQVFDFPVVRAFIRESCRVKEERTRAYNADYDARRAAENALVEARKQQALAGPWSPWVLEDMDIDAAPAVAEVVEPPPMAGWVVRTSAAKAAGMARFHTMRNWIYRGGEPPWLKEKHPRNDRREPDPHGPHDRTSERSRTSCGSRMTR